MPDTKSAAKTATSKIAEARGQVDPQATAELLSGMTIPPSEPWRPSTTPMERAEVMHEGKPLFENFGLEFLLPSILGVKPGAVLLDRINQRRGEVRDAATAIAKQDLLSREQENLQKWGLAFSRLQRRGIDPVTAAMQVAEKYDYIPSPQYLNALKWSDEQRDALFFTNYNALRNSPEFVAEVQKDNPGLSGVQLDNRKNLEAAARIVDLLGWAPSEVQKGLFTQKEVPVSDDVEEIAYMLFRTAEPTPDQAEVARKVSDMMKVQQKARETRATATASYEAELDEFVTSDEALSYGVPLGTTRRDALSRSAGVLPNTKEEREVRADAFSASSLIGRLENHAIEVFTDEAIASRILNGIKTKGQVFLKTNPHALLYNNLRESMISVLSRQLGGERGVLTNQDIERIKHLIPDAVDFFQMPRTTAKTNFDEVYGIIIDKVDAFVKALERRGVTRPEDLEKRWGVRKPDQSLDDWAAEQQKRGK